MQTAKDSEKRLCIDLFCGLGGFSQAMREDPGWEVLTVDILEEVDPDLQSDVLDLGVENLPCNPDLVLSSPPCTVFTRACPRDKYWTEEGSLEPTTDTTRRHILLVHHTIGLIKSLSPDFWFLENPTGRLREIIGDPEGWITLCQFGTSYQKPTDLWGNHPDSFEYLKCPPGSPCHNTNKHGESPNCNTMPDNRLERAKMPYELSKAIKESVENPGKTNQATLKEL